MKNSILFHNKFYYSHLQMEMKLKTKNSGVDLYNFYLKYNFDAFLYIKYYNNKYVKNNCIWYKTMINEIKTMKKK